MHHKWREKFDFNCQATNGKSQGTQLKDNSYCPAFTQISMDMKFEI